MSEKYLELGEVDALNHTNDQIIEQINHYKKQLEALSAKKKAGETFTPEDKKTIAEARELAQNLESRKEATELVQDQSRELRTALKEFSDNKNEIILLAETQKEALRELLLKDEQRAVIEYLGLTYNDVKNIRLSSALELLSQGKVGTDYESWLKNGYNPDGVFGFSELSQLNALDAKVNKENLEKYITLKHKGIKLIDVENTELILNNTPAQEVYKVIFDVDNSLDVSTSDNKNIIQFKNAYELVQKLVAAGKEKQVLASIGNILGTSFATQEELHEYLKKNPEGKYIILKNITTLAGSGNAQATYVSDILEYGKDATKKSLEKKSKVDTYLAQLFDKEKELLNVKYDTAIADFESKIPADKKEEYAQVLQALKSTQAKKELFDSIKLNGVGLLASLVEAKRGAIAGASFSARDLDTYLKEKTSNIISGVNFEAGFGKLGERLVPGVGVSLDLSHDISQETRAFGKVGIVNLIPFAMAGLETQLNASTIQSQGFTNFTEKAKYAGASINVSTLGWGLGVHYRQDQLKGIAQKEKQFHEFLQKAINDEGVDSIYLTSLPDYTENKQYYDVFVKNVNSLLDSQNFSELPADYKKAILNSLKTSLQFMWKEGVLQEAEKNGYEFAGAGIGIQFFAGFVPLPTFGVAFEKVTTQYNENQVSKLYATLGVLLPQTSTTQPVQSEPVDGGEDAQVEGMSLDGNSFKQHEAKFKNFAQKHPLDWKKLVTGNLDFPAQVELVAKMLSSSKDRFLKATGAEFKKLLASQDPADQKKLRDLMAQFFDVSFKDQRDISQVVLGYTVDKNGKYEGKFDFRTPRYQTIEKFSHSLGLQDFAKQTQDLYGQVSEEHQAELKKFKAGKQKEAPKLNPIIDKTLFGFVASYKIDAQGKSLGKGFINIPAGQVSKVDGKEIVVTNQADKEFIAKKFADSYYGKATWENIKKIIESKKLGIDLSQVDFAQALATGEIYNKDGKTIKLNSEFVTFLYGQCANESMGLRIKKLDISGFNTPPTVDLTETPPEALATLEANTTNMPSADKTAIGFGVIGGDKKSETPSQPNTPPGGNPDGNTTGGGGNNVDPGNGGGGDIG